MYLAYCHFLGLFKTGLETKKNFYFGFEYWYSFFSIFDFNLGFGFGFLFVFKTDIEYRFPALIYNQ